MHIGCHGLVWTSSFDRDGLEKAVTGTVSTGYDLLEIPLFDPFGFDLEAATAVLAEHPVTISASLGLSADADLLGDPEQVAAGRAKLVKAVDVVADLGGAYLVGVLYSQLAKYTAPVSTEARRRSVAALQEVADHASTRGLTLGLEVVNRYETNLFTTARGALAYIAEIDRPNVGVHLDTYHMNIEEPDMIQPILESADKLVYVHVGESHRGYLGTGTVDFDTFFKGLAFAGYDGPITFESFSSAVADPSITRMLAVWRDLWDDSADLAAHANGYIRNRLHAVETIRAH